MLLCVFALLGQTQGAEPPETLEQSLTQAMEKNPGIVAAKAKIALAQAELSSTQLEVARKLVALWGDWQTQQNAVAVARKTFQRVGALHGKKDATADEVDRAKAVLVDAEARLARTRTELNYLLGHADFLTPTNPPAPSTPSASRPSHSAAQKPAVPPTGPTPRITHPPVAGRQAVEPPAKKRIVIRSQQGSAEKIHKAMTTPAAFDFKETPLESFCSHVADKYKIGVQLDTRALEDMAVTAKSPITSHVQGVTLRSALDSALRQLHLTWVIQDDVLLITTQDEAANKLCAVIYPVQDLGAYDSLIGVITSTVQPPSWDEVGGPGTIAVFENRGVLAVSQTRSVHEEIVEFLDLLRKGAQVPPEAASSGVSAEPYRKIAAALERPVQVQFANVSLSDAIIYFKDRCKIAIELDSVALEDAGIEIDAEITFHAQEIPLKSALRLMLKELGLTYTIGSEVLRITTPDAAGNILCAIVYPVRDLVTKVNPTGESDVDFDSLIQLITATVQPQSWDEVGGPGSISGFEKGGLLVISQTTEVHEEIAQVLKDLRQHAAQKTSPRQASPSGRSSAPDRAGASR